MSKRIRQLIPFRHLLSFGGKMQDLLFSAAADLLNLFCVTAIIWRGVSFALLLGRSLWGVNYSPH